MYCIVLGSGLIGSHMAEVLDRNGYSLAVIDPDATAIRKLEDRIDFRAIVGNALRKDILESAEVQNADLVLCVTDDDTKNILAAMLAKKLGAKRVVARVRSKDLLADRETTFKDDFGIDHVFCPDTLTAEEIAKRVQTPGVAAIEFFAEDKVHLREFTMPKDSPLIGTPFRDLGFTGKIIVTAIFRDGKTIIPDGTSAFMPGDTFFLIGNRKAVKTIGRELGDDLIQKKNVLIFGGGGIGFQLAQILENTNLHVKLLEPDAQRCRFLSENLDRTLVLNGSGLDLDFLTQAGIQAIDTFITVTPFEDDNIVAAILAKEHGAKEAIALIQRPEFMSVVRKFGIDTAVSPRLVTAGLVVRAMLPEKIRSMAVLSEHGGEVLEIKAQAGAKIIGTPLEDLDHTGGFVIASLVRHDDVIIPSGKDCVQEGDIAVVFTLRKNIPVIEGLF